MGRTGTPRPLLVADGVGRWFGDRHVLRDIDLTIEAGQVVALVGPSGSGKSTLCRTLNRLEPVDAGEIRFRGEPLPTDGRALAELRADVAMVLPSFNLLANRTIVDNVAIGPVRVRRSSRPEGQRRAQVALERVGLGHRTDAMPGELSDVEQQLAAMARALALGPEVLLLEDPTGTLEASASSEVWSVIGDLARTGTTMVIVTGELDRVRPVAHRIVFMEDGRVVEDAPPDRFFVAPRTERARVFLAGITAT